MDLLDVVTSTSTTVYHAFSHIKTSTDANDTTNWKICAVTKRYKKEPNSLIKFNQVDDVMFQNFMLNIICWLLFIFIFSCIRKHAWGYGILAVIKRASEEDKRKRIHDFFRDGNKNFKDKRPRRPTPNLPTVKITNESIKARKSSDYSQRSGKRKVTYEEIILGDAGIFSWLKVLYKLTENDYLQKSGVDCSRYLSFQRHLIVFALPITLISCFVIIPVNLQGTAKNETVTFFQTTINNIKFKPKLLFVHVCLSIAYVFWAVAVLRHFCKTLTILDSNDTDAYRTVMIQGLEKSERAHCSDKLLTAHFQAVYPEVRLLEATIVYNVSEVLYYHAYRMSAQRAILYLEDFGHKYNFIPKVVPCCCGICCTGRWCLCRLCCTLKDALEYFEYEQNIYRKLEYEELASKLVKRSLGIAFITFETPEMAMQVMHDYRTIKRLYGTVPLSKFSRRLNTKSWKVQPAPLASDLQWQNMTWGIKAWYFRAIVLNITLAIIGVFYSTPAYILDMYFTVTEIYKKKSSQDNSNHTENVTSTTTTVSTLTRTEIPPLHDPHNVLSKLESFVVSIIPALLLWVAAVTLPSLVALSDEYTAYWTKTAENRSRMIKTFTLLVLMIVVLPCVGRATLTALVATKSLKFILNWECAFSRDTGEFFMNYVITSTFIGTGTELLRLPELMLFFLQASCLRSRAEVNALRQLIVYEFQIGPQYAWMMLNFTIFTCFSFVFPIMTPFGFIYLNLKHWVDRYNIYFVYGPAKVQKEVHITAVHFVMAIVMSTQTVFVAYLVSINKRSNKADEIYNVSIDRGLQFFAYVGLATTIWIFLSQTLCDFFNRFNPVVYRRRYQERVGTTEDLKKVERASILKDMVAPEIRCFFNGENRRFIPKVFKDINEYYLVDNQVEEVVVDSSMTTQTIPKTNFSYLNENFKSSVRTKKKHRSSSEEKTFDDNSEP